MSAQGLWGFVDGTQSFFWSSPKILSIEKGQGEGLLSPSRAPSWRLGDILAWAVQSNSSKPPWLALPHVSGAGPSCSSPYCSADKGAGFRTSLIKIPFQKVLACQCTLAQPAAPGKGLCPDLPHGCRWPSGPGSRPPLHPQVVGTVLLSSLTSPFLVTFLPDSDPLAPFL